MARAPRVFDLDEPAPPRPEEAGASPRALDLERVVVEPQDDPFSLDAAPAEAAIPAPRRSRWRGLLSLALSALGGFLLLVFLSWAQGVVLDLIAQNRWLGIAAATLLGIAVAAALTWVARELWTVSRLRRIEGLRAQSVQARLRGDAALAGEVALDLGSLYASRPETARARARIAEMREAIIDAGDRLDVAESALLQPLDLAARAIVAQSAKRVAAVTAISPRAIVDILFVGAECVRMVRRLAVLYGARPGFFGSLRLLRETFAHLAVTGGVALGDDLIQQLLGQSIAARLSARLGEGVVNGLLTARVGLAAIIACRPLPFVAERMPTVGEVAGALLRRAD